MSDKAQPRLPSKRQAAPLAPSSLPDVPGPMPATARVAATVPPGQPPLLPVSASSNAGEDRPPRAVHAPGDQHAARPAQPGVPLAPPGIVPESDVRVHTPSAAVQPSGAAPLDLEGLGALPFTYGDGRLVALVRDPRTLYVYWDLSRQQIDQAFAGLGLAGAVLKLWNARSHEGELVRETDVHLEARGWYVRDLPAGGELRAELWAAGERGQRLLRAARPVRLPAGLPSDQLEAFYVRLDLNTPLPRDGVAGARTLDYVTAPPPGWERREQSRHQGVNRTSSHMPWSMSHLRKEPDTGDVDVDKEDEQ